MIRLVRSGEFTLLQFNGPCEEMVSQCGALCCRMRRYYSVQLEDDERHPSMINAEGKRVLVGKPNGDCIYLEGNKCGIYDTRPKGCREWHCSPEGGLTDPEITKRNNGWVLFPAQEAK